MIFILTLFIVTAASRPVNKNFNTDAVIRARLHKCVAAFDTVQCRLCVNNDVFYYILPLVDILAPSIFACGNVIITSCTVFSLPLQFPRSDEMLPFHLGNCSIQYLLAEVSVARHLDIFAQLNT